MKTRARRGRPLAPSHPCRAIERRERGLTLVESVVGLVVFVVVVIPVMQFAGRLATSSKGADLQAAYAILKGECDVIYGVRRLPMPQEREIAVDGRQYILKCAHHPDTGLVSWTMAVRKDEKTIAGMSGLVYVSGSADRYKAAE